MNVVLTGHSRGLGAALTEAFIARGDQVLGLSRGSHPKASVLGQGLKEVALDLSDVQAARSWLLSGALASFLSGHQTVCLINNAGLLSPVAMSGFQENAEIYAAVTVNVASALALTNQFLKDSAQATERRLLHISSGAARTPYAGWNVYCATKAALDQHAQCLALEAHPRLRLCSLAPGVIDTEMQAQVRQSDIRQFPMRGKFDQLKTEGQLAGPDAVAERLIRFLESPGFGHEACADLRTISL
jgi:NAD(P)-dependent dehydrogenase (short-subunit alcohol dehydrogenase family)